MRSVLVSAHNPMTGPRHLGHYISTMVDWPRLQQDHELFVVIDDLIAALLYPNARSELQTRTLQAAKEFVATGVDFQRNHLVLTSMVPEVHELCFFTYMSIEHAWCDRLYRESFAGLLTSYQRRELGLPKLPSLAEIVYPQLHLATMTVGLGTQFFQGGEEMKGYVSVLEAIVENMGEAGLFMPAFMPGKSTFLVGIDGRHMASENAIYLSADSRTIEEQVSRASLNALRLMCQALGLHDVAGQLASAGGSEAEIKEKVSKALVNLLRPFRESKASVDDLTEILERSAIAARERVRQTLIKIKTRMPLPGYA